MLLRPLQLRLLQLLQKIFGGVADHELSFDAAFEKCGKFWSVRFEVNF